jgi:hypothetical protein
LIPDSIIIHFQNLSPPRLTAARVRPSGLPGEKFNISFGSMPLLSDGKELGRHVSPATAIFVYLK